MERAAGDNFKANSFYKAHGMIVTYAQKINSGKEAAKLLKGVGKSIATMIDDLLTTGTTTKLEDKKKGLEDVDTVSLLETVIGINHQFAKSLVNDHSIKSIKDLLECNELTEFQVYIL
jgi:DNA polymerase/3'-5' exonuclease PolX